ncbi:MAG: dTMP kinase [Deltaproteobacteria bacterium]|nr:dTMP kinase [Deltaproteobacteria bacterium]
MRDPRGGLIAFEGTEGTGKSTQLQLVADALRRDGHRVHVTREPGGTPLGAEIRRLVMHVDTDVPSPLAELLLYLADRAQHLDAVIRPALAAGELVLTDRFSVSTIAYQGYGRQLDLDTVIRLDTLIRGDVSADLTILLDSPVDVGLRRAHGDDRFHRADLAFHERVRHGFLTLAAQTPDRFRIVDVTRPCEDVTATIVAAIRVWLQTR